LIRLDSKRWSVLFVAILIVLRSSVFYDFSHGLVAIVVVQIAYPISLLLLLHSIFGDAFNKYTKLCFSGVAALIVAQVLSVVLFESSGSSLVNDELSRTIFIGSFFAQLAVYLIGELVLYWTDKYRAEQKNKRDSVG
jgi:hypothetical protein